MLRQRVADLAKSPQMRPLRWKANRTHGYFLCPFAPKSSNAQHRIPSFCIDFRFRQLCPMCGNCLFQNMYYIYICNIKVKMDRKVSFQGSSKFNVVFRQALRRNEALVANFWELRRRADIYYAWSPSKNGRDHLQIFFLRKPN